MAKPWNKKVKNHAPQSQEEAEGFSISDNVGELLADVVGESQENPSESVEAAAGSKELPKLSDLSKAGFENPPHGKEYSNHPKFNKFKNQKGSK